MNNIDFSIPRRQSFNGIFLIFLTDLVKRIRQNIYILAVPFFKKNLFEDYGVYIYLGIALLVIIQFIYSYLSYRKFKFSIQEDAFHLDHGVVKLSHVEIPFERIQNINIQQNIFQQILNVVGFEIETAGEGTAEINIKALDKPLAKALKDKLIEEKHKVTEAVENTSESTNIDKPNSKDVAHQEKEQSLLFQLSLGRLIKVGLSSNLFKGVGVLLAFFAYLYNIIMDFVTQIYGLNLEEDFKNRIPETLTFSFFLILGVLVIGFIITILSTIFKYYNLKVLKNNQEFEVEYGLFKRINKVIKKSKTQIFEVSTNPIKKLFKIKSIFISQAASAQVTEKQKIGIVGVSDSNLNVLFTALYGFNHEEQQFEVAYSQMRLFFRYFYKSLIAVFVLSLPAYLFWWNWISILGICLLFLAFIGLSILKVNKSSIGLNSDLISLRSGTIDTKVSYIELHKLQSVKLVQNIFQQYNHHADLIMQTASGSISIEYLKKSEAEYIMNYLMFKIESNPKHWI